MRALQLPPRVPSLPGSARPPQASWKERSQSRHWGRGARRGAAVSSLPLSRGTGAEGRSTRVPRPAQARLGLGPWTCAGCGSLPGSVAPALLPGLRSGLLSLPRGRQPAWQRDTGRCAGVQEPCGDPRMPWAWATPGWLWTLVPRVPCGVQIGHANSDLLPGSQRSLCGRPRPPGPALLLICRLASWGWRLPGEDGRPRLALGCSLR